MRDDGDRRRRELREPRADVPQRSDGRRPRGCKRPRERCSRAGNRDANVRQLRPRPALTCDDEHTIGGHDARDRCRVHDLAAPASRANDEPRRHMRIVIALQLFDETTRRSLTGEPSQFASQYRATGTVPSNRVTVMVDLHVGYPQPNG